LSTWSIAFGDYALLVDRKALTYHLTETKTGTVWAEGLSLGWVALENRETGEITRHAFGEMTQFSVSEKAGPQGKRILFGLDIHGVPIDLYLICSLREIQMVVEANRDSTTHKIAEFCLLPGLCSVPDDNRSYLVLPHGDGAMLLAKDTPSGVPQRVPVWGHKSGFIVTMPFVGAVQPFSALALITDSAYAEFELSRSGTGQTNLDIAYSRDPERRRIDLRAVLLPSGDHVAIARTYREKVIGDQNHVTLRRKAREKPALEQVLGAGMFGLHVAEQEGSPLSGAVALARDLKQNLGIDRGICLLYLNDALPVDEVRAAASSINELGYVVSLIPSVGRSAPDLLTTAEQHEPDEKAFREFAEANGEYFGCLNVCRSEHLSEDRSRWEAMDEHIAAMSHAQAQSKIVVAVDGFDWSALASDIWRRYLRDPHGKYNWEADRHRGKPPIALPLYATIYHDAVIAFTGNTPDQDRQPFLRSLLNLSPLPVYLKPWYYFRSDDDTRSWVQRTYAVLGLLHRLTFSSFLTAHRFLTADFLVEEAVYSDKTHVVINQSETETYNGGDLTLPPLGFYVRHAQLEAHDALRVGDRMFDTRAWRIARSQDGKPLEESEDVLRQEFPV
jgi:hypothetical protein